MLAKCNFWRRASAFALLANIYLHPLDLRMMAKGYRMIRYADDFVVLCRTAEEAEAALIGIRHWIDENGLTPHPDKTHTGDCREKGQGFEFLGYRFEAGKRWVRKKSLKKLKERIRQKTRRTRGDSLKRIIEDINPSLKGWYHYFKHAHRWTFERLDGFVRRRLRAILRQQNGKRGFGRSWEESKRWPNVYFANAGLFALYPAWRAESHP